MEVRRGNKLLLPWPPPNLVAKRDLGWNESIYGLAEIPIHLDHRVLFWRCYKISILILPLSKQKKLNSEKTSERRNCRPEKCNILAFTFIIPLEPSREERHYCFYVLEKKDWAIGWNLSHSYEFRVVTYPF